MTDLVLKPTPLQNSDSLLVLASGSVTRRHLLNSAGLSCSVMSPDLDEAELKQKGMAEGWTAAETALRLAEAKALAVQKPDTFVIGADQMLSCNGTLYDKPPSLNAARQQLEALRGQTHTLHTAVVLCHQGKVVWHHVAEPKLTMRTFSSVFLEAYLAEEGTRCLSSVGAYRVEGPGLHLFERIEGEHAAILGLPLFPLLHALRDRGVILS